MMQHHTATEALLTFLTILLLLLFSEYYLLALAEEGWLLEAHRLIQLGAQLLLRVGKGLRVITLLTYAGLTWMMVKAASATSTSSKPASTTNRWLSVLVAIVLVVALYLCCTVTSYQAATIYWLYPASLLSALVSIPVLLVTLGKSSTNWKEVSEQQKLENEHSIHIPTSKGYVNVVNPYRGSLVIGSSGSGKSKSIGNAFLHQFVRKGYCGIVYDFKFPTLAGVVNTALHLYGKDTDLNYYLVNFQNLTRSHRCNPLAPENIPTVAHAEEYARAIVNNLDTNTIKHREFFSNSAIAWLAALIWFYRSEHPQYCTLPHVINTALYQDYTHVISMLEGNAQSADMIRSIATAIQNKADKQIAGVIASLQIMVTRINSPEIAWVLSGDDFDMNINDPANPKLLCLGSDPGLVDTFSPVISLMITVALKQMNHQGKHKSFVLLDEAPTLYIPKFELIPATARENQVATVYMAQDLAQMNDMFGKEKTEVIVANLSNQFYGKVSSVQTAKAVSEMIGKEEQMITNHSRGSSRGSKGQRNLSYNTSTSPQERYLVKPQQVMQLQPGQFIGQTVESSLPYFWAQTKLTKAKQRYTLDSFKVFEQNSQQAIITANFQTIRQEVADIVKRYPNVYA